MENKLKHLEIIQSVISRMANNSFLLKGWAVTLVSALIALGAKDTDNRFILVAYLPVIMFWILDGYFLQQERLFRNLYEKVRKIDETSIDFSMNTAPFLKETSPWLEVMFSQTLLLYYGVMIGVIFLVMVVVGI